MESEFPTQLSDGQIMAYIDDMADNMTGDTASSSPDNANQRLIDADLSDHPEFAAEIQQLRHTHETLADTFHRTTAPTALELGEYLLGLLAPKRANEVAQAIATHPALAREAAALEAYWTMLEPTPKPAPEPGPSVVEQAVAQANILIATVIDNLSGHLTAGATPALAGIRGDAGAQEQLTFEAGAAQIIIETQADSEQPDQRMLLGLVIGLDAPETFDAFLYHGGTLRQKVTIDELGNFVIPNISPDLHELILSSEQSPTEIHIQNVRI